MKSIVMNKRIAAFVMASTMVITGTFMAGCNSNKDDGAIDKGGRYYSTDENDATYSPSNITPSESTDDNSDNNKPTAKPYVEETSVSLLAVGDNIYHKGIWESGKTSSGYNFDHLYKHVSDDVTAADIAIINQETPFAPDGVPSGYPNFGAPDEVAQALVNAGFDVIEQASNHSYDKREEGVLHTLDVWSNFSNISVLGMHASQEDADEITVIEKNGIKVAMLDYTYGLNGHSLPSGKDYLVDVFDKDKAAADVAKAKEISDCIVVFMHWGVDAGPSGHLVDEQEEQAKFFADLGVLAIVGTHPHVCEPVKWVEGESGNQMLVYYSLGNFVSRQASDKQIFEAMAKFTITKNSDGVKITKASVVPLVMHYEKTPSKSYGVYKLDDYTKELAAKNYVDSVAKSVGNRSNFSYERMHQLSIDMFGADTEVELEIPGTATDASVESGEGLEEAA